MVSNTEAHLIGFTSVHFFCGVDKNQQSGKSWGQQLGDLFTRKVGVKTPEEATSK